MIDSLDLFATNDIFSPLMPEPIQSVYLPQNKEGWTANEFLELVKYSIRIPARTPARRCERCPAMIYDVPPAKPGQKPRVVSIAKYKDQPHGVAPSAHADGAGISHFADCPAAAEFRRKKR